MITIPSLELQLTDTCQHQCAFCANGDGPNKQRVFDRDSLAEVLARTHIQSMIFTGGEPTAHLDLLLDEIRMAKESGVETVKINTNVELLNAERLRELEVAGLDILHFALNTFDQEKHCNLRRNPHAKVEKVCENIETALAQTQLRLKPEFVCMKENMEDFWNVYDYLNGLCERYPGRIGSLELQRLIPVGRAASESQAMEVDDMISVLSQHPLGELPIDAYCFGKQGRRLEQYGVNALKCVDATDCGCSLVRVDVEGNVSSTNFSGRPSIGKIATITEESIQKLLGEKCPLAEI